MKFLNNLIHKKFVIGFIILIMLLALFDWLLFGRTPMQEFETVKDVVSQKLTDVSDDQAADAKQETATQTQSNSSPSLTGQNSAADSFNPKSATDQQFKTWLNEEVREMSDFNVNEEALQQRYLKLTAQMTAAQFQQLSKLAQSSSKNVSEKILAAYLLSFSGYDSLKDLSALAQSSYQLDGVPKGGQPKPHSLAETQQVQERALRILAINRLVALAQGDQADLAQKAYQELKSMIRGMKDSYLKDYAQNKFKEISK